MNQNAVIVIPIYKESLSNDEDASLRQCCKLLSKYDIVFICPKSLNLENYEKIIYEYNVNYKYKTYDDNNFLNTSEYSKLLLDKNFYKDFLDYKFMLIYQLDAWVFSDELEYWCKKGYDYIGAPWFEKYGSADYNSKLLLKSGNGGFSLRCIKKMYETLNIYNAKYRYSHLKNLPDYLKEYGIIKFIFKIIKIYKKYKSKDNCFNYIFKNYNEDYVISNCFDLINPTFNIAKSKDAIPFSFEVLPELLFKMNQNKLPFGCHAYKRYNWQFWEKYIIYTK